MKKCIVCFLMIILFAALVTGCSFKKSRNENIMKYELQTHEYFSGFNHNTNKFYIDSEEELEEFYSLFSDTLNIDKTYLKDNTIFIQVKQVGSGSIKMKLEDVTFDNNTVNFSITEDIPEMGTDDMACWYLVAIIPNHKLQGIKFDEWIKPSKVTV